MFPAAQAPVRPRVFPPGSVEAFPLEDEILALLHTGSGRVVFVVGPSGAGKTTALRHLAAVLPATAPVALFDGGDKEFLPELGDKVRLIVSATAAPPPEAKRIYQLAPWGNDEFIEYLLAAHRAQCASVMARLQSADRDWLRGTPELWRVVLDVMAQDPSITDARAALRRVLDNLLPDNVLRERAGRDCRAALRQWGNPETLPAESLLANGLTPEATRLLRHQPVALMLAAEDITHDLRAHRNCAYLAERLPRALVQAVGAAIVGDEPALARLQLELVEPRSCQPMAASLLLAADPSWVPPAGTTLTLAGAYLDHAAWAGADLALANLHEADLRHADLRGASLERAVASRARLRHACLANATMHGIRALEADLQNADLTSVLAANACWDAANLKNAILDGALLAGGKFQGTVLTGARCVAADLRDATLFEVQLDGADFSDANCRGARLSGLRLREACFRGACFAEADLSGCDMEGMDLPGVDCENANLENALLTDARLAGANLRCASLSGAGLGDVNLQGACLCDADLRRATFHMGSARSGLLFTPIASEGTRTGFYTDDADEQYFKSPEEIRKANLCGADLRGAQIDGVDFYLVDLRGALYSAEQEQHFRRCRAILEE